MSQHVFDPDLVVAQDESAGILFRNGAFVAAVQYTLVTVENNPRFPVSTATAPTYTSVLRFASETMAVSDLLNSPGEFALEMADGHRLACHPLQPLGTTQLRWMVRLS